jgi:Protein of unknown function (DUF1642)
MSDKAKVARVALPREVAEAIEKLREKGLTNYGFMNHAINLDRNCAETRIISGWLDENFHANFEVLMIALVNGYEIEKSPEEKVREFFESCRQFDSTYYYGAKYGIITTLNILDIKIPGVNADA